jgi:hypothetical protein
MNARLALGLIVALGAATGARADVVSAGATGFVLHFEVVAHRDAAATWQRLVRPEYWWGSEHTYTHDARNLSLTLAAGGCWCERLQDGGFVRHMEVVYAAPGHALRLSGGLGPLQKMGVSGALTFTLHGAGERQTKLSVDYVVSGYAADGFTDLATAVNGVLNEQLEHLVAG